MVASGHPGPSEVGARSSAEVFGTALSGLRRGPSSSFIHGFMTLTRSPEVYRRVSESVQTAAAEFTFEKNRCRLRPLLTERIRPRRMAPGASRAAPDISSLGTTATRPLRVLFNGHDLKFLRNLIRCFSQSSNYEVQVEEWKGHNAVDQDQNETLLRWADVIFCEWCLGNAKRYSERKRPGQRLFIRLHHQEMGLPYRNQLDWRKAGRFDLHQLCPLPYVPARATGTCRQGAGYFLRRRLRGFGSGQAALGGFQSRAGRH